MKTDLLNRVIEAARGYRSKAHTLDEAFNPIYDGYIAEAEHYLLREGLQTLTEERDLFKREWNIADSTCAKQAVSLAAKEEEIHLITEDARMQGDALAHIFSVVTDEPAWSQNKENQSLLKIADIASSALVMLTSYCPHEKQLAEKAEIIAKWTYTAMDLNSEANANKAENERLAVQSELCQEALHEEKQNTKAYREELNRANDLVLLAANVDPHASCRPDAACGQFGNAPCLAYPKSVYATFDAKDEALREILGHCNLWHFRCPDLKCPVRRARGEEVEG